MTPMTFSARVAADDLMGIRIGAVVKVARMTLINAGGNEYDVTVEFVPAETSDPNDPPLIDGCRIVHRGDGFDVCKVHYRHWRAGTQMCPSKSEAAWVRVYEATHP